ncbi:hypothetical protein FB547_1099 [Variovorax beijingensis]|uniref:Uncharacterized protein n=1 Tax=Variovorax beijingensis TaxID=2496117 RepID=A0A561BF11_9BURK|nr:hypothetical protein [Variovorax beijingensis]TWD77475.1 hypothetical protein FB547_1099 [Variovorax beijingensis]
MSNRHKPARKAGLTRTGRFTGWESDIDFSTFTSTNGKFAEFRTREIIFSVELLEPINGERSAKLNVSCYPPNWVKVVNAEESAGVAKISVFKKTGVEIHAVVNDDEWTTLLTLTTSGQLASVRASFDALVRGKAIVQSLRFSTRGAQDLNQPGE